MTQDANHEVQTVAEGHAVEIYCEAVAPDPAARRKRLIELSNNLSKIGDKVKACPLCGAELDPQADYWVE